MPPAKIAAMQAALRHVWPRFSYLGVAAAESRRRQLPVSDALNAAAGRDAVATLLQVLGARLMLRSARRRGDATPFARPQPGCNADPAGGDISPHPGPMDGEPGFEGRTVNGWII